MRPSSPRCSQDLKTEIAKHPDLPGGHAVLVIENWQSDDQGAQPEEGDAPHLVGHDAGRQRRAAALREHGVRPPRLEL